MRTSNDDDDVPSQVDHQEEVTTEEQPVLFKQPSGPRPQAPPSYEAATAGAPGSAADETMKSSRASGADETFASSQTSNVSDILTASQMQQVADDTADVSVSDILESELYGSDR